MRTFLFAGASALVFASPAAAAEEADLILAVNAPATRQAHHQPNFDTVDTALRHLPELIDRLVGDQAAGRMVAVAELTRRGFEAGDPAACTL